MQIQDKKYYTKEAIAERIRKRIQPTPKNPIEILKQVIAKRKV